MANNFSIDAESLLEGLTNFNDRVQVALRMYAETSAQKLESYAKENRKWTDRSSDARKRLKGSVEEKANGYRLILAHGVPYGIWLELANEKRFAIIETTINVVGNTEIMPGLERMFDRMSGVNNG